MMNQSNKIDYNEKQEEVTALRKRLSPAENYLKTILKDMGNRPILMKKLIGNEVADCCLPYRKLVIRVVPTMETMDLQNLGLNVLELTQDEIFNNSEGVKRKVNEYPMKVLNHHLFYASVSSAKMIVWKL